MPLKPLEATEEEWSAAERLKDAVNMHLAAQGAGAHGRYIAARLSDGRSDGSLYDSRADAARHQVDDPWCFYVKVNIGGMQTTEAWVVLMYARQAKRRGVVFCEEEVVLPQRVELAGSMLARAVPALFRGSRYSHAG